MKKEVSYLIVAIVITLGIVVLYYGDAGPTGYVTEHPGLNLTDCETADAGNVWYNGTCYDGQPICDTNFLDLCLDETNCTVVGNGYWYNNLCYDEQPVCDADFLELCLDETNCTVVGNGYWYDANEDGSSTCNVDEDHSCSNDLTLCLDETNCTVVGNGYWYNDLCHEAEFLSLIINEPSGTKDIDSGIPIEFSITGGENISLSCLYNIKYVSDDTVAIANTTLVDCNNSSFDVPDEGDYVLNLYVNNFEGFFHDDSSFSVSLSSGTEETSETTEEEESAGGSSVQVLVTPSFELIASELSALSSASGDSQGITWSISNTGRNPVSECSVNPSGDYAAWITSEGVLSINAGEEGVFGFSVLVPEGTEAGSYPMSVAIECEETAVSKSFNVEVSGITGETGEGAPVGGFVIFGEGGMGVGGIIILVFMVLALGAVLFFARKMRKSGKTLKNVFDNLKLKLPNFKKRF